MALSDDLKSILNNLRNMNLENHQDAISQAADDMHETPRNVGDAEESEIKQILSKISGEAENLSLEATELERFFSTG